MLDAMGADLSPVVAAEVAAEHGPAAGADEARAVRDFEALHAALDAAQADVRAATAGLGVRRARRPRRPAPDTP